MNNTTLNFLSDEGAITVTFTPSLTPEQYAALHALMAGRTRGDNLEALLKKFAEEWKVAFHLEPT